MRGSTLRIMFESPQSEKWLAMGYVCGISLSPEIYVSALPLVLHDRDRNQPKDCWTNRACA